MKKKNYLVLCTFLSIALSGCGAATGSDSDTESTSPSVSEQESDMSSLSSEEVSNSSSDLSSDSSFDSSSSLSSSNSVVESSNSSVTNSQTDSSSSDDLYDVDETFDFEAHGLRAPTVKTMPELPAYTPTTINTSTYTKTTESLSDGVDLIKVEYNLTNGGIVKPYCVVVDLNKANIVAGSYNNTTDPSLFATTSVPYNQAKAWLNDNPTKKYIAVTNADFFGSTCVNAFVKDGVIMKSCHNSDVDDAPVSMPMLFGVSSAGAKIAPMTEAVSYQKEKANYLKTSLSTSGLVTFNPSGEVTYRTFYSTLQMGSLTTEVTFITSPGKTVSVSYGQKVYMYKKIQEDKCEDGEIRGCIVEDMGKVSSITVPNEKYGYMIVGLKAAPAITMSVGDYFGTIKNTVTSKDGIWNNYDTILGCRQSLVEAGNIPETLAEEKSIKNNNGAGSRVPRTAVGIMPDGRVVIVSVEDLHYGKKADTCTGLTMEQLGDFMRYFGCYDAANFDGGGSSQLITNVNGTETVRTISSDTGSSALTSSRKVLNTIIVTTK